MDSSRISTLIIFCPLASFFWVEALISVRLVQAGEYSLKLGVRWSPGTPWGHHWLGEDHWLNPVGGGPTGHFSGPTTHRTHDGSMVLPYMLTWIPSIYPKWMLAYIPAPWILWAITSLRGHHGCFLGCLWTPQENSSDWATMTRLSGAP